MDALLSPVAEFLRGLRAFPAGMRWLLGHPRHLALLLLPSLAALLVLVSLWGQILDLSQWFTAEFFWARPLQWYLLIFWWLGWALMSLLPIGFSVLAIYLLMKALSSPIFEIVSTAIEKDLTGLDSPRLSLSQHITVIIGELKKALVIIVVPVLLLFVPGVNFISVPVAAFLIGWDFFDYPLARRGWSFRQRWRFVAGELWSVMGFGLWFLIPFLNLLLTPFAIAGGTLLGVDCMRRRALPQGENS